MGNIIDNCPNKSTSLANINLKNILTTCLNCNTIDYSLNSTGVCVCNTPYEGTALAPSSRPPYSYIGCYIPENKTFTITDKKLIRDTPIQPNSTDRFSAYSYNSLTYQFFIYLGQFKKNNIYQSISDINGKFTLSNDGAINIVFVVVDTSTGLLQAVTKTLNIVNKSITLNSTNFPTITNISLNKSSFYNIFLLLSSTIDFTSIFMNSLSFKINSTPCNLIGYSGNAGNCVCASGYNGTVNYNDFGVLSGCTLPTCSLINGYTGTPGNYSCDTSKGFSGNAICNSSGLSGCNATPCLKTGYIGTPGQCTCDFNIGFDGTVRYTSTGLSGCTQFLANELNLVPNPIYKITNYNKRIIISKVNTRNTIISFSNINISYDHYLDDNTGVDYLRFKVILINLTTNDSTVIYSPPPRNTGGIIQSTTIFASNTRVKKGYSIAIDFEATFNPSSAYHKIPLRISFS